MLTQNNSAVHNDPAVQLDALPDSYWSRAEVLRHQQPHSACLRSLLKLLVLSQKKNHCFNEELAPKPQAISSLKKSIQGTELWPVAHLFFRTSIMRSQYSS